jgi:hypothetical protein
MLIFKCDNNEEFGMIIPETDEDNTKMSDDDETSSSNSTTKDDNYEDDDLENFAVANLMYQYKSIDTIVPNVDNHYITCFKGEVNVVAYKFIQDAVYGYALIIQGIFPIVNDFQGKIGKTEEFILRYLNPEYFPVRKVSFNDVCPYSSTTVNKVIDQSMIAKIAVIDDVINDTYSRLEHHLVCVGSIRIPCVYIGGRTCQTAFLHACSLGIVTDKICLTDQYQVSQCRINGQNCLVLEGRNHPSAHLMSGSSSSVGEIIETIFILNAMGRCTLEASKLGLDDIPPQMFQMCLEIEQANLAVEKQKQIEGRALLTQLLYKTSSGRFPEQHRMLRFMDGHNEEVRKLVSKWISWGQNALWSTLLNGSIYLNPLEYNDIVEFWHDAFSGDVLYAQFMSSGIARFIIDEQVHKTLINFREKFNNDEVFVQALSHGLGLAISDPNRANFFLTQADEIWDQGQNDIDQVAYKLRCLGTQLHENRRTTFSDTIRDGKIEELKAWKKTRRSMSTAERDAAKAKDNARKKAKRDSMSTEERDAAKAKDNARDKAKRDSMSTEERKAARAKDNARKKAKRESMSTAERKAANAEKAARKKAKWESMSTEERDAARAKDNARKKAKLDSKTTAEQGQKTIPSMPTCMPRACAW